MWGGLLRMLVYILSFLTVGFLYPIEINARDLSILFIGNSYTYYPGIEKDPGLPKYVQQIAESVDSDLHLKISFHTPGGYSFERHFRDVESMKLMGEAYDRVVLQGQSIESLELTPWFKQQGFPDVDSFSVYLPKVLDFVFQKNSHVTLFINWGWNPRHSYLQDEHPGLRFPEGTPKAGQKWCGNNKFDYQRKMDESYLEHLKGYPVHAALVGRAWLELQLEGLVTQDELYVSGDWSHPSELGSLVTALVLAKEVLGLDIATNAFIPPSVDKQKAKAIALHLSKN